MNHDPTSAPTRNAIPERRKAALYLRVSAPNQLKKGDGLNSQEAVCREFAEQRGYDVEEVFRDNVTGGINDRPAMEALLAYVRKRKKTGMVIIVDDLNRFSRDVPGFWELRARVAEAGGKLESPREDFGDDADSKLQQNIKVAVAQHQREKGAEQTKDRMRGRLLNGYWPFIPPRGMVQQRFPGMGLVLVRIEPEASVIAEGLQLFADGQIRSQAEFARWLDAHPDFRKGKRRRITNQQAHDLLTNVLYAGMVERPKWDVSLRKGRHQGLISYETFERIRERLNGASYVTARHDVSADFPLRGSIACAECRKPLTACWSTSKTGVKHPYYMCFARECSRYRKSIRREAIEGEFVALLEQLTPGPKLLAVTKAVFRSAWDQRSTQAAAIAHSYERQIGDVDKKIAAMLDRIVEASTSSVIGAFEKRIAELERSKLVLQEKRDKSGQGEGTFDELFELALGFLANPSKLWHLGKLEYRRLVLRLAFREPLAYMPETGFSNPKTTIPFSMLGSANGPFEGMAERKSDKPLCQPVSHSPTKPHEIWASASLLSLHVPRCALQCLRSLRVILRVAPEWQGSRNVSALGS